MLRECGPVDRPAERRELAEHEPAEGHGGAPKAWLLAFWITSRTNVARSGRNACCAGSSPRRAPDGGSASKIQRADTAGVYQAPLRGDGPPFGAIVGACRRLSLERRDRYDRPVNLASRVLSVVAWPMFACSAAGDGDANTDASTSGASATSLGTTATATTPSTTTVTDASVTDASTTDEPTDTATATDPMTTAADAESTGGGPPQASPGCGLPATVGASEHMIDVGGVLRTFTVTIPDPYDPEVPRPLVFGFHGLGGTGAGYYIPGGLDPAPIVVGPNAEPAGGAWNTVGDLDFVDAIVAEVGNDLCVDLARVFASGYSNGGFMADAVACQRSDVFRGVAVMEGGSAGGVGCGQTAMWIMHNQDDMTVPIDYGNTLRDQWLLANGCGATTQPIAPAPCVRYDGCAAGNPVVWCSPATGGHNPNYDAAAAVPAFFDTL